MTQKIIRFLVTDTQKYIFATALFLVLFTNITFFEKIINFALQDNNLLAIFTTPFVLFFLFVLIFNIVLLLTHKVTFKIFISLLLLIAGFCSYFMNSFGTIIDKDMITNAMGTDTAEVLDLITLKLILYVIFLVIVPIVFLIKSKIEYKKYYLEVANKIVFIVISFMFVAFSYLILGKNLSSFFRNHSELKYYTNPTYPIFGLYRYIDKNIKANKTIIPIGVDAKLSNVPKKRLFILVVGETARAENFSLNGYSENTNPLMKVLENKNTITNLPNFYSCGTATAVSVPCMFSKFGRDDYSDDKQYYENLVDVLTHAGVRVIWRDNNSGKSQGVADRLKDKEFFGGGEFDEIMLQNLQKSIDKNYQDTFIVLHQEGSHGPTYFKRYPEAFKKFTPTCDTQDLEKCTQQQIVNTYNNTIAYTDYFLNETIKLLQKNDEKYQTFMLYASDHGESLGENGIYLHGLPYMLAPDSQKHIPAILWFGKDFEKEKNILENKKRENFSHDNIFHTMVGLFGITTKEYSKDLDILIR